MLAVSSIGGALRVAAFCQCRKYRKWRKKSGARDQLDRMTPSPRLRCRGCPCARRLSGEL
jgi:hypothetical protein